MSVKAYKINSNLAFDFLIKLVYTCNDLIAKFMPLGKYIRTEKHRERIRNLNLGKKLPAETKRKMSFSRKKRVGDNSPNYGNKHSEETKQKIREKMLGRYVSKETRKKRSDAMKGEKHFFYGKKLTEEHKNKISKGNMGRVSPMKGKKQSLEAREKMSKAISGRKHSEETKKKISLAHTGKKRSKEHIKSMSKFMKGRYVGNKNSNWKGGATSEYQLARNSDKYSNWRLEVYKRDYYTCRNCNKKSSNLCAHHIKNFSHNKELRYDVNNGITFCSECHREFHSIYSNTKNTKEQVNTFLIK